MNMKTSLIDEYRKCAEICRSTDYGNSRSVKLHNRSAKKMHLLVLKASKEGDKVIEVLAQLLNDSVASEWLSYQLLEVVDGLQPNIELKCLEIIQKISNDSNRHADSYGARVWLARWAQKKESIRSGEDAV